MRQWPGQSAPARAAPTPLAARMTNALATSKPTAPWRRPAPPLVLASLIRALPARASSRAVGEQRERAETASTLVRRISRRKRRFRPLEAAQAGPTATGALPASRHRWPTTCSAGHCLPSRNRASPFLGCGMTATVEDIPRRPQPRKPPLIVRSHRVWLNHPSSNPLCSNFSVAAFSETVRTFASSNPVGAVASTSIVTLSVTPGVAPSGPRISSASFLKSEA